MKRLAIVPALLIALTQVTSSATARPRSDEALRFHEVEINVPQSGGNWGGVALAGASSADTALYGGTVWAADSSRWEAIRGGTWTFQTGVGSNFTEPTQYPKPAGYHHRAEGWIDIDRTYSTLNYFRRSTTCAINGTHSFWAGVTLAEANALCYASGQGYGHSWNMAIAKTFNYPGAGSATLGYRYAVDSEPGFDYFIVLIDTTGNGSQDDVEIARYDGAISGTASHPLTPGSTLRSTAGPVTVKFLATSDGAYDDQDGLYLTSCGHSAFDDVTLTGALSENASFETGSDGWANVTALFGVGGLWMDLRSRTNLPPPLSFCPCAIADSVMVFADDTGGHNTPVDNVAISPYCDLRAGGDSGRPGKLIIFHGYFELALTNYIFLQVLASWYPAICPLTGLVYTHPLVSNGFVFFFTGNPNCTAPGAPNMIDFSGIISPEAEQIQIAVGVLSFCSMFANCTGVTNSTPWLDQVALGVYGTPGAPIVTLRTIDVFQDNFARDGTLNPSSSARVDINTVKGNSTPQPNTALGDTLVINGDGGNQEVRVLFRVRPGAFTNLGALNSWASLKWTNTGIAAPGYFQNSWFEARCDSAEQGGTLTAAKWMSTLHEQDPKFGGGSDTDRGAEGDVNQLSHDIFPDNILTPGSRIDYFVRARYLPPDPRNPGGTNAFITPDTTGGRYLEMEILPSSFASDTTWNCLLYVDHRADRDFPGQALDEQGLTAALGVGGNNAEGTRFDRYDVQAPSSLQASLGRPLATHYGASIPQIFAYQAVTWASGNIAAGNLVDEDANILSALLTFTEPGGRRFWASGDGLARSMNAEGEPTTLNFLFNILGSRFSCDTIRLAACPTGSALDSTFCLPLSPVAGAHFMTTSPIHARGNGCPNLRSFDLLTPNSAIPTATRQLTYQKNGAALPAPHALSVANWNTVDVDFKTVLDGVDASQLRSPSGDIHSPAFCNLTTPAIQRSLDVIQWFQLPTGFLVCRPLRFIGVPIDDTPAPILRSALRGVYPNPMQHAVSIRYANARENGRVRIEIVDVTGRLVRRLQDLLEPAGLREAQWDGRDDQGRDVVRGLYFVTMTTPDTRQSQKVIVTR